MNAARNVLQWVFRMVPWPCATGLRAIGTPNRSSPVLVTGNYDLTVRRLVDAMKGQDAWLVVAPSSGVNVWCAAAGGHFGTHQVVTALKTCGVEERVDHRRVILPQLAATGVERSELKRRCGWSASFGPVHAQDLPRYLEARQRKDDQMRRVRFGAYERSEMAVAWGGPAALVVGSVAAALHAQWAWPLATLALLLSVAVFFVYDRVPGPRRTVVTLSAVVAGLFAVWVAGGGSSAMLVAVIATTLLCLILTFDYAGSTPIEGGSFFDEKRFHVVLDLDRCRGVYSCWEVCPEACFEKPDRDAEVDMAAGTMPRKGRAPITLLHEDRCVRCGACVVQCPLDALAFETTDGERIEPGVIRQFKLNLLGKRTAGERNASSAGMQKL